MILTYDDNTMLNIVMMISKGAITRGLQVPQGERRSITLSHEDVEGRGQRCLEVNASSIYKAPPSPALKQKRLPRLVPAVGTSSERLRLLATLLRGLASTTAFLGREQARGALSRACGSNHNAFCPRGRRVSV